MRLSAAAADHAWPALGTTARVRLHGPGAAEGADAARWRLADLEERWSRFLAGSEVSMLNDRAGEPVAVGVDTAALVADARDWSVATGGRFDPTVLPALRAAGYVRSLAQGAGPITGAAPAPGVAGIEVDRRGAVVRLPRGVQLDLGGIGKGRAADLVAADLVHVGGGLVDLGGDLVVWGRPPEGNGWPIAIEDGRTARVVAVLGLSRGAVATSSCLRRRWTDGRRRAHHLIDPTTGRPSAGPLVAATVVAGNATGADVLAKAAVVSHTVGAAVELLDEHGVAGLLVPRTGSPLPVGDLAALCWSPLELG